MTSELAQAAVAVLVPCYNEESTIGCVVEDFRRVLPQAAIYVYDNNSRDGTALRAERAGAVVRGETMQGKGHVVRRMFSDIEADAYLLVDGDGTYDPACAAQMVELLLRSGLDMVVGRRVDAEKSAYRPGHRFGNALLTGAVSWLFGDRLKDILSGYRVFSRRFVKSFPAFAPGFAIETEMSVHALTLRMPIQEVATHYKSRPEGSVSKLRTYRDGFHIVATIFHLVRDERPLFFFTLLAAEFAIISMTLAYPVIVEFLETGLVPRFPTAILATGLALLSALSLATAFILDTVTRGRRAAATLAYLAVPRWRPLRERA